MEVHCLHGGLGYIKSLVVSFCPAGALTVKVLINSVSLPYEAIKEKVMYTLYECPFFRVTE
jgi:hypothetical protein